MLTDVAACALALASGGMWLLYVHVTARAQVLKASVYLLYWYKSTNTDVAQRAAARAEQHHAALTYADLGFLRTKGFFFPFSKNKSILTRNFSSSYSVSRVGFLVLILIVSNS
jgi:hypothetical protein